MGNFNNKWIQSGLAKTKHIKIMYWVNLHYNKTQCLLTQCLETEKIYGNIPNSEANPNNSIPMGIIAQCCFNWLGNYFCIKESETYFFRYVILLERCIAKKNGVLIRTSILFMKWFRLIWHMKLLKWLHFFRNSLYISQKMSGHTLANKRKKITVDISFPVKRCLISHSRSEINKMKFEESEYKSLNDAKSHRLHQINVSIFC